MYTIVLQRNKNISPSQCVFIYILFTKNKMTTNVNQITNMPHILPSFNRCVLQNLLQYITVIKIILVAYKLEVKKMHVY